MQRHCAPGQVWSRAPVTHSPSQSRTRVPPSSRGSVPTATVQLSFPPVLPRPAVSESLSSPPSPFTVPWPSCSPSWPAPTPLLRHSPNILSPAPPLAQDLTGATRGCTNHTARQEEEGSRLLGCPAFQAYTGCPYGWFLPHPHSPDHHAGPTWSQHRDEGIHARSSGEERGDSRACAVIWGTSKQ